MPKTKPQEIGPELRDEICRRFAETQNVLEVSRSTGVSGYRVRRLWNSLTSDERARYTCAVQATVQRAAEAVIEQQTDQLAQYAESLLRVRIKALSTLERMLDTLPVGNPQYFPLLKDIGKVLRDLHEMAADTDSPRLDTADEFYRLLKSPSTINIQHNYYGKREEEHPSSGDQPRRIG